jgi:septal ring factor EnvC (AmiA/AmiB activator)
VAADGTGWRHSWIVTTAAALLPVLAGALATIAWQNSHRLVQLQDNQEVIRRDLDEMREEVERKDVLRLRFEADEREIADLRHQLRELQSDVNQALRAPLPGPKRR